MYKFIIYENKYQDEEKWYRWNFDDELYNNIELYTKWEFHNCRRIVYVYIRGYGNGITGQYFEK
jgi:hypothetical protein